MPSISSSLERRQLASIICGPLSSRCLLTGHQRAVLMPSKHLLFYSPLWHLCVVLKLNTTDQQTDTAAAGNAVHHPGGHHPGPPQSLLEMGHQFQTLGNLGKCSEAHGPPVSPAQRCPNPDTQLEPCGPDPLGPAVWAALYLLLLIQHV